MRSVRVRPRRPALLSRTTLALTREERLRVWSLGAGGAARARVLGVGLATAMAAVDEHGRVSQRSLVRIRARLAEIGQ